MAYVKCLMNVVSSTIPDGKTVTPTDDVSILIACAGRTETYTTISALLADAAALAGVINSNNAIDYLVRSTTFASDICADQGAMTDIGANNYASNTLLANSTWLTAICGSTYFESVLNVKVPVMTSNNTPSGVCDASTVQTTHYAWKAFDGLNNTTNAWIGTGSSNQLSYEFVNPVKIYCSKVSPRSVNSGVFFKEYQIEALNTDSQWDILGSNTMTNNWNVGDYQTTSFIANTTYSKYRINILNSYSGATQTGVCELQFYGRADV